MISSFVARANPKNCQGLAGIAILVGAENLGRDEISIREHNGGRMPAELHGDALHVRSGQHGETLGDRHRVGERDLADGSMRDEVARYVRRHPEDEIEQARRQVRIRQRACTSAAQLAGVSSGPLRMIEQPAASAAATLRAAWLIGKF
jgi:hypothetical protein